MNTKAEMLLPLRGACVLGRYFCLRKRLMKVEGRRLFALGPRHPSREGLAAILGELLANAVKYADVGGSVAVSAARTRGSGAEGYGLGLAIARRRAEVLGGSISCESDPGLLTTFTLEIPAR